MNRKFLKFVNYKICLVLLVFFITILTSTVVKADEKAKSGVNNDSATVTYDMKNRKATVQFQDGKNIIIDLPSDWEQLPEDMKKSWLYNQTQFEQIKNDVDGKSESIKKEVETAKATHGSEYSKMETIVKLIFVAAVIMEIAFIILGYNLAKRKNRNKILWGVLCGVNVIFVLALLLLDENKLYTHTNNFRNKQFEFMSDEQNRQFMVDEQNRQFMERSMNDTMSEATKATTPFEHGGYDMNQGNSFNNNNF